MSVASQHPPPRSTSRLAKRSSLDQARTPSIEPLAHQAKPAERPRRKLQKNNPARRSASSASPTTTHPNTSAVSQVIVIPRKEQQPSLRSPPDLSDAKWVEYLQRSSVVSHTAKDTNDIPNIIPELSHLTRQAASPRPSIDSSNPSSPTSSTSTASTTRRRAKTPVHTIGQLEGEAFRRELFNTSKTLNVDVVGVPYRPLLDTHDAESINTDPHSEPPLSRATSLDVTAYLKPQLSAGDLQLKQSIPAIPIRQRTTLANSPAASDGTLVEFDEEAIYFKPLSCSPEPPSPLRALNKIQAPSHLRPDSTLAGQGNLSLQICTELLTRELAMVMLDRNGASSDSSALQILVMIEAYERLRDRVLEEKGQRGDLAGVETMFDSWLGALYSLHDAMSGDASVSNESEDVD